MEPQHLQDDLKQEVILKICEMPEEKLLSLHESKVLEFYTVRVIINEIRNPNNSFAKKYRGISEEITNEPHSPDPDFKEREVLEELQQVAINEIQNLYWYDKELLLTYLRLGSYRAVTEYTGIPVTSIFNSLKKSMKVMKQAAIGNNEPVFKRGELCR
jgi:hypothetical protein